MIIVSGRTPVLRDEHSWPKELLREQNHDLQPEPAEQERGRTRICSCEQDVTVINIPVQYWHSSEDARANDILPCQGFATISHDVSIYLWNPEREEAESEEVEVDVPWS